MQSRRLIIIVILFVCLSHLLYMAANVNLFREEYEDQSITQIRELGEVIEKEIEYALDFGIPIRSLGGMNPFLASILESTPQLSYIRVSSGDDILFKAERGDETSREVTLPIISRGTTQAFIHLGLNRDLGRQTAAMLFDLITISIAGLIIAYEIIRFFASKLVETPFRKSIHAANTMAGDLTPFHPDRLPVEFYPFLSRLKAQILIRTRQVQHLHANLNHLTMAFLSRWYTGRQFFLAEVNKQRKKLNALVMPKVGKKPVSDPSQVRPIVFIFFFSISLQSSFLPIFSRELLARDTFLSALFSTEILMGLPITCYMIAVFFFMLFMGSNLFRKWIPLDYAIALGTLSASAGLVLCGLSNDILQLIFGRVLCAAGFAVVVIYCKQFIIAHSAAEDRAYYLAGFTSAFSGGLFCSIIIGSIMVEYFSYRLVFFSAAAIVLLIFVFDYMIMADKTVLDEPERNGQNLGLAGFFKSGITDKNLIFIMCHGIITRIIFVGYFYYCLPIFLKQDFSYGDIGRIMMFYGLPSILFAGLLNRQIKKIKHSLTWVAFSNIALGIVLVLFSYLTSGPAGVKAMAVILTLVLLGISNSITFPAQSSLLLSTPTARKQGARTALSVYNSFERVGSGLGPVFFGIFAARYGIVTAIEIGGGLCILGNLIFLILFRTQEESHAS